jgi:hypothetical protein
MGELGYMALAEYDPGAAFPGVIGRTTDESSPAWPTGRGCPGGCRGPGRSGSAAKPGEVRRVGKHAAIVALPAGGGGARIEVAASAHGCERAPGPFAVGGSMR